MSFQNIKNRKRNTVGYTSSQIQNDIVCLICSKMVSVSQEYQVKRHHETTTEKIGYLYRITGGLCIVWRYRYLV